MRAVVQLLQQEHLSKTRYGEAFKYDPGLCLQLVSLANHQRQEKGRFFLTNLENVLSHHSEDVIRQQVKSAVTLESLGLPEKNYRGYLATVAQSCHASLQAREWADARKAHEPETAGLAALFQFLAELYLWAYGGDAMLRIQHHVRVDKMVYAAAAEKVLGCSTRSLSAQLAEKLFLTELTIEALTSEYSGFTLGVGIALAARLAQLCSNNWYSSDMMDCISAVAAYQGHAEGEVETRMHRLVVDKTDVFVHSGLVTPARLLPMLADDNYVDPDSIYVAMQPENPVVAGTVEAQKPANKAAETKPVAIAVTQPPPQPVTAVPAAEAEKSPASDPVASLLTELQQLVRSGASVQALIQQSVNGIAALGFDATVFLILIPKQSLLLGKFVAPGSVGEKLAGMDVSLTKPHLLTRLMEKPLHLWINQENLGRYRQRLPDTMKLAFPSPYFVAMSVFADTAPVGLMLAGKSRGDISAAEDKTIQGVCRLLGKAILLTRQKTRAGTEAGKN